MADAHLRPELLRTDGKGGRRAADRALEVPPPRRRIESVAWVVAAALDVSQEETRSLPTSRGLFVE